MDRIGNISYYEGDMKEIKREKLKEQVLTSQGYRRFFPSSMDEHGRFVKVDRGEVILQQEEDSPSLYYIVSGRWSVSFLMPNGKTVLVNTLEAGGLIGEVELLEPIRCFTVRCLEDSVLVAFSKEIVEEQLGNDPNFLRQVALELSRKERSNIYRLIHAFTYPLQNRLAKFILDYSEGELFQVRKVVMAQTLGASYRQVENVLTQFIKEGILEKEQLTYRIRKRDALLQYASELQI